MASEAIDEAAAELSLGASELSARDDMAKGIERRVEEEGEQGAKGGALGKLRRLHLWRTQCEARDAEGAAQRGKGGAVLRIDNEQCR